MLSLMDTNSPMKKRGPKPIFGETMRHRQITIDDITRRKLIVLGSGNLSAGVRIAADKAYDKYQEEPPKEKGR